MFISAYWCFLSNSLQNVYPCCPSPKLPVRQQAAGGAAVVFQQKPAMGRQGEGGKARPFGSRSSLTGLIVLWNFNTCFNCTFVREQENWWGYVASGSLRVAELWIHWYFQINLRGIMHYSKIIKFFLAWKSLSEKRDGVLTAEVTSELWSCLLWPDACAYGDKDSWWKALLNFTSQICFLDDMHHRKQRN